uniref:Uncharacterized protein n=1 Tax=Anguilla anguilla TaxID=7936 RepID=A0A0E9PKK8_ANGAN
MLYKRAFKKIILSCALFTAQK